MGQDNLTIEYDDLVSELKRKPQCSDKWLKLIHVAEGSEDIEKILHTYESFLLVYPSNAFAQVRHLDHLLRHNLFKEAEFFFRKSLTNSHSVDLWKRYIDYVRHISAPDQHHTIEEAYEYALAHIGQDRDSGFVWSEYISFLRNKGTVDERQALTTLCKIYYRAVRIPLRNVDSLWKELEDIALHLNDVDARNALARLSPAYMRARDVLKQLDNFMASLDPPQVSGVYIPPSPSFSASERGLIGKWKNYLKWEESNPLGLDGENIPTLHLRIRMAYKKAVTSMPYHTEIWFMAYDWFDNIGLKEEAMLMLTLGLKANPSSHLLTFTLAEAFELKKKYEDVHATYLGLLVNLREQLENCSCQASVEKESWKVAQQNPAGCSPSESARHRSSVDSHQVAEIAKRRTEYGLVWVMYMRFGLRAEGTQSLRSIFGKVRRDRWATWETYDASARMEYHHTGDKDVGSRIYEKGMTAFGHEVDYILRYLEFLLSINDPTNARVLFERALHNIAPEHTTPLWQCWSQYQYMYGDLEDSLKLGKRMAEHNLSGIIFCQIRFL
ncbi:hypothetical protein CVT26_003687 [Gymnopilus dilepis]|uniref:mRNA 3'-end-processing protein RNA14 n=1 Tax=Gymnopilus dilepis TaxID=231916 RepID=A0A409WU50_9AGAR|nr:hypothetical protein CVT26_003687 [Gymnopilus dilepis]